MAHYFRRNITYGQLKVFVRRGHRFYHFLQLIEVNSAIYIGNGWRSGYVIGCRRSVCLTSTIQTEKYKYEKNNFPASPNRCSKRCKKCCNYGAEQSDGNFAIAV